MILDVSHEGTNSILQKIPEASIKGATPLVKAGHATAASGECRTKARAAPVDPELVRGG